MRGRATNVPYGHIITGCTPNAANHDTREESKSLLSRRPSHSTRIRSIKTFLEKTRLVSDGVPATPCLTNFLPPYLVLDHTSPAFRCQPPSHAAAGGFPYDTLRRYLFYRIAEREFPSNWSARTQSDVRARGHNSHNAPGIDAAKSPIRVVGAASLSVAMCRQCLLLSKTRSTGFQAR